MAKLKKQAFQSSLEPIEVDISIDSNPMYWDEDLQAYTKMYDGSPLSAKTITYDVDVLRDGDFAIIKPVKNIITDAGKTTSETTVAYKDADGNDVTDLYRSVVSEATLIITQRDATLTSGSATKEYDGTALTVTTVDVTGSGFVDGEEDGVTYSDFASITRVGTVDNTFTYTFDGEIAKEGNYDVTQETGTLTITERQSNFVITINDLSKMYDGDATFTLTSSDYSYTCDKDLVSGDYFVISVDTGNKNAGEYSLTSSDVTLQILDAEGNDVTNCYNAITINGFDAEITKRSLTMTSGSSQKMYDGTPLTNSNVEITGDGFIEGEGCTFNVTGSQTEIGTSDNTFTYTLNQGTDEVNYDIEKVYGTLEVSGFDTPVTITVTDDITKTYDGSADYVLNNNVGYTVEGLYNGDVVTTITVSATDANAGEKSYTITSWTIMRDGRDITSFYTNVQEGTHTATYTIEKKGLHITAGTSNKVYDGTALTNATFFTDGGVLSTETLDTASVAVTGTVTHVSEGIVDNVVDASGLIIRNADGEEVQDNYDVTTENGTLSISARAVKLVSSSGTKTYDGTPLVVNEVTQSSPDINENIGGFIDGDGAVYVVTGSQTLVGTSENEFTYEFSSTIGSEATDYQITAKNGTLTVKPVGDIPITITVDNLTKTYDGEALEATYSFTDGILLEGDTLVVTLSTNSRTAVGSDVVSVASYKVMRGSEDVTSAYTFADSVDGSLTVEKRKVTLTSGSKTVKGDETTVLTDDHVSVNGFVDGEGAYYVVTGVQEGFGCTKNAFEYHAIGNTNLDNYDITKVEGLLTVVDSLKPKADVDGNGISDVMFQYTGGDYQIGYWLNGTNEWTGTGVEQPANWELIGSFDMDANGKADAVMRGNVGDGAYIGFYKDGDTTEAGWKTIGYLNNEYGNNWEITVGNLTGNDKQNSIVWYSDDIGTLGAWTDGTDQWTQVATGFNSEWKMEGTGDFNGDGKDEVLFSYNNGYYTFDIDGNYTALYDKLGDGWDVKAIGDFSGNGKSDIIVVHESGMVAKLKDGTTFENIGTIDTTSWDVIGAGNYDGDRVEDLLVRNISDPSQSELSGMLGYYAGADMSKWNEIGRGVDTNWTVVA